MSYNFKEYQQDQLFLLPVSITDWVKEDSIEKFVSETLDLLYEKGSLACFLSQYNSDGIGAWAYHPVMLLKVLIYAYCRGVVSSRVIARSLENDIAMRFLAANSQPDFRTISDFRKNNIKKFEELFVKILRLCQKAGLVKMGKVAIDGTKVQANASLSSNKTKDGIEKEVAEIIKNAEKTDGEEDVKYGKNKRGDELPEELRRTKDRLKRLNEAYDRLEAEEKEEIEKRKKKIETRENKQTTKSAAVNQRSPKTQKKKNPKPI
jgi:transposase